MPTEQAKNRAKDGRFKPGVSGNPNGRPRGSSVKFWIEKELDKAHRRGSTKSKGQLLGELLVEHALKLRPDILRLLLERIWPATQQHQVQADLALNHDGAAARLQQKLEALAEVEEQELELEPKAPEPLAAGKQTLQPPPAPAKKGNGKKPVPVDDYESEPELGIPEKDVWSW